MRFIIDGDIVRGKADGNIDGPFVTEALAGKDVRSLRFKDGVVFDATAVTNWHVDAAGERHVVAAPDRTQLQCTLTDEIERDGAGGWRAVDQLARLKARRKTAIDAEAERQRLRWITPGAGQAMTYARKVEQANAVLADEDPQPEDYPMLAASIGIDGPDIVAVANTIIAMDRAWEVIGAAIEQARLSSKNAVDLAASIAAVNAITVIWPEA